MSFMFFADPIRVLNIYMSNNQIYTYIMTWGPGPKKEKDFWFLKESTLCPLKEDEPEECQRKKKEDIFQRETQNYVFLLV